MKKSFTFLLIGLVLTKEINAQANQSLSNLTVPTAVNTALLPGIDNSINFGSSAMRWKKIYTADDASLFGLTFGRGGGGIITNTAAGAYALNANTTGSGNTASGYATLYDNQNGSYNSASGYASLYNNISGSSNTAMGYYSLFNNTSGYSNIAVGFKALYRTTSQGNLVAVGDSTLFNNGLGATASYEAINNTAVGSKALFNNTTGPVNTAVGSKALYNSTTGGGNTGTGSGALYSNTTGPFNTGCGFNAVYFNTTGGYNTGCGFGALFSNGTGSYNTALGYGADVNSGGYTNSTVIGSNATVTASNQVRIGNSAISSIGGYTGWTNISDGRVKKNIQSNVPGLAFINKLKPVTYNLDLDAADNITGKSNLYDQVTPGSTTIEQQKAKHPTAERKAKEAIVYTGFIAQEVDKAARSLNYDFSGIDAAKNSKDLYGLRYAEFVVPLVKAVQELDANQQSASKNQQTEIDALKKENESLKTRLDQLEKLIAGNQLAVNGNKPGNVNASLFSLEQNIPNPGSGNIKIRCNIPVNNGNVYVNLYSQAGVQLKSIKVTGEGKTSFNLSANELSSGTYKYVLMVDGKITDSKTMVVAR